jgi:hypothetical protein
MPQTPVFTHGMLSGIGAENAFRTRNIVYTEVRSWQKHPRMSGFEGNAHTLFLSSIKCHVWLLKNRIKRRNVLYSNIILSRDYKQTGNGFSIFLCDVSFNVWNTILISHIPIFLRRGMFYKYIDVALYHGNQQYENNAFKTGCSRSFPCLTPSNPGIGWILRIKK